MRKHRNPLHRGISAKAQEASLMHPARSPQDRCCLIVHGISADGTGTLTTGLAVRRGRNGLASCQSACHSSDEPRAGSADLHTDHSVVREPHIQKTPCGHMAASAVVCGRPGVAIESPKRQCHATHACITHLMVCIHHPVWMYACVVYVHTHPSHVWVCSPVLGSPVLGFPVLGSQI